MTVDEKKVSVCDLRCELKMNQCRAREVSFSVQSHTYMRQQTLLCIGVRSGSVFEIVVERKGVIGRSPASSKL